MKKIYNIIIVVVLMSITYSTAHSQQHLRTNYFVPNATLSHQLNPALTPEKGYFGIPLLSQIGLNMGGNTGISSFLYPVNNGKLGLFLHPDVSNETFLNNIPDISDLNFTLNYDILSLGWFTSKNSFWSIDVGAHVNYEHAIPKEFFKFLKLMMDQPNTSYDINNLDLYANAHAYINLGYSREIIEGLRVGGKVKAILSVADAKLSVENMKINMTPDKWSVNSSVSALIAGNGLAFKTDDDGKVTGIEMNSFGLGGYGLGFDLGATYQFSMGNLLDNLQLSFAVTDLGFTSYSSNNLLKAQSKGSFEYSGFENIDIEDIDLDEQMEALTDDLMSLVALKEVPTDGESLSRNTETKIHLGAKYTLLNDMIGVGVLYSRGAKQVATAYNELTLSCYIKPARWFSAALSYSILNVYDRIGWVLNFTPNKGINFFLGSDYTYFKMGSYFLPVNEAFFNVHFGLSVPMGKRKQ